MPNVFTTHPIIESILGAYQPVINQQFAAYRNHVYRVYNYSLPVDNQNDDTVLAIAAAYHDIGIWTNATFDYLAPSCQLAVTHGQSLGLNANQISLLTTIINEHHKVTKSESLLSNNFRLADWHDVTFGLIGCKCERSRSKQIIQAFPYTGLHRFLAGMALKRLFTHPTSPLPMMRW